MQGISDHLAWWGWKGSALRRFSAPHRVAYKIYWATLILGPLFFVNVLFAWPSHLYPFFLFAFLLWLVWLIAALWLITRLDIYDSVPIGLRLAVVFSAGGFANGLAGFLNAMDFGLDHDSVYTIMLSTSTEEVLKFSSLLLIYGISPAVFRRPTGAVVCGFIAGIAFSFNESFKMSFSVIDNLVKDGDDISMLIDWVFRRGILYSPWTHSAASGAAALCLWAFATKAHRKAFKTGVLCVSFLVLSVLIHFGYNFLTLGDKSYGGLVFWMAPDVWSFLPFILLILWCLRTEQMWFCRHSEKLEPYLSQREAMRLLTRSCRAEKRAQARLLFGRRQSRLLSSLQRLQIAYVNVCSDSGRVAGERDIASLRSAITETKNRCSDF